MKALNKLFVVSLTFLFAACAGIQTIDGDPDNTGGYDKPERTVCDVSFCGFDSGLLNPDNDKRSYYKVFIDKSEVGRTTIGLESQKKFFEIELPVNRHLLSVEKWALNEKTGSYEKLNNVHQPKPAYCYFEAGGRQPVSITMEVLANNRAVFTIVGQNDE